MQSKFGNFWDDPDQNYTKLLIWTLNKYWSIGIATLFHIWKKINLCYLNATNHWTITQFLRSSFFFCMNWKLKKFFAYKVDLWGNVPDLSCSTEGSILESRKLCWIRWPKKYKEQSRVVRKNNHFLPKRNLNLNPIFNLMILQEPYSEKLFTISLPHLDACSSM